MYDLNLTSTVSDMMWYETDQSQWLVLGTTSGVFFIDITQGNAIPVEIYPDAAYSIAIDSATNILAVGSRNAIHLINLTTGDEIQSLDRSYVLALAFNMDGSLLAAGDGAGQIGVWETDNYNLLYTFETEDDDNGIHDIQFNPEGTILASGHQRFGPHLWDLTQMPITPTVLPGSNALSVAFSSDSVYLAVGRWRSTGDTLQIWDSSTNTITFLSGHEEQTNSVAFGNDENILITGGNDTLVGIWNVNTMQQIASFDSHDDWVISIQFNRDQNLLASASWDGVVLIWGICIE
jgi:hypothetical protein